jgi:hypothetical protein
MQISQPPAPESRYSFEQRQTQESHLLSYPQREATDLQSESRTKYTTFRTPMPSFHPNRPPKLSESPSPRTSHAREIEAVESYDEESQDEDDDMSCSDTTSDQSKDQGHSNFISFSLAGCRTGLPPGRKTLLVDDGLDTDFIHLPSSRGKKYECLHCSKRFNRPSSMRIHVNTHTGARRELSFSPQSIPPYPCPIE